jgi:hypothetical protein
MQPDTRIHGYRGTDSYKEIKRPNLHPAVALSPLSEPKASANPCDRLRIRTNPVIGPSSPSFSMLKLARASSPVGAGQHDGQHDMMGWENG